jgi:hypothetical protein
VVLKVDEGSAEEINAGIDREIAEPEQDDARVGKAVPEYEIAEILVVRQNNLALDIGDRWNFPICHGLRAIMPAHRNIMPFFTEIRRQAIREPLVEKKPH